MMMMTWRRNYHTSTIPQWKESAYTCIPHINVTQRAPQSAVYSHNSEVDVDARQHDPEQDQDQPAFNRLWNNQYAVLTELDM
eukprot:scaffold5172_cov155-Amphora_coffeaeformis.AAC.6